MKFSLSPSLPASTRTRGFTLIELAIVLAVMGLLIAGLFQLTSASARTIQGQATAQQIQQYVRGAKSYLAARMQVTPGAPATVTIGVAPEVVAGVAVGSVTDITARVTGFRPGLSLLSPLGSTYQVRLLRLNDVVTTSGSEPVFAIGVFMVGGATLDRPQLGAVSTLVGAEGAGVYDGAAFGEADVGGTACNEAGTTIRSAYGALCVDGNFMDGGLGIPAVERPGALAYGSLADFSSSVSQWLSRTEVGGAPQMTTMSADLRMGGALAIPAVDPGNDIIMLDATNDLYMNGGNLSDLAGPLNVNDTLNIRAGGSITMNGGGASISDAAGDVLVNDGLTIASGNNLAINGSINGTGGGGVQGITFFNSSAPTTFPLNIGSGTVAGDTSLLTFGTIASTVGMRVEGSLSARSFIYVASDRSLKDNIKPISSALDKLLQIDGVSYRLKASGQNTMGVIAQDVEKVMPELVTKGPDGLRMVNYNGLTGALLQAVHELAAQNKALRERVEKLEARPASISQRSQ